MRGFDVRTGKQLWTFHVIPHEGEFGYDTWKNGSAKTTGAGNLWTMLSGDEELGYVYLPLSSVSDDHYAMRSRSGCHSIYYVRANRQYGDAYRAWHHHSQGWTMRIAG